MIVILETWRLPKDISVLLPMGYANSSIKPRNERTQKNAKYMHSFLEDLGIISTSDQSHCADDFACNRDIFFFSLKSG